MNTNVKNAVSAEDVEYMREALSEAELAYALGEVPVGAVLVRDGEIIARAHNTRETAFSAIAHAEVSVIASACEALHGWRLEGCTLYVTLEPCPMCAGAIVNARIDRVVYAAPDLRAGAFGSKVNLNDLDLNHKPEIVSGVCCEESRSVLSAYFRAKRKKKDE